MKIIEGYFEEFKEHCLEEHQTEESIESARATFFAGAAVLFSHIVSNVSESVTTGDIGMMDSIHQELVEFVRRAKDGR